MLIEVDMPKFLITTGVVSASGWQLWEVEAETIEEARKKFDAEGGDFVEEEIEVTDIAFESIEHKDEVS